MKIAREKHVDLEIYPNAPRDVLGNLLGRSKVFIHATRGEHFGIAIVEAMATGLPVIVHRSGGQYYDIIKEGVFGLHYRRINELAELIDKLMTMKDTWSKYSELSRKRSMDFSREVFEEKLRVLIKGIGIDL